MQELLSVPVETVFELKFLPGGYDKILGERRKNVAPREAASLDCFGRGISSGCLSQALLSLSGVTEF